MVGGRRQSAYDCSMVGKGRKLIEIGSFWKDDSYGKDGATDNAGTTRL